MVFGAEPQIDVAATDQMVDSLFTGARFVEESDLGGHACPDPWMVCLLYTSPSPRDRG